MGVNENMILVLKSSGIGDAEPDLGIKLMGSLLDMMIQTSKIPAKIICLNSGIYLTTDETPVAEQMQSFLDAGVEISSCGTCLDYYGRKDKLQFGQITNMKDIVTAITEHKQVISM